MIHNGEYVLVDIDEVSIGHPLYDLTYHYINHEFLAKQPENLMKSTCLTPKLAKQSAKITRSTYFKAMDIKTEKLYKKLICTVSSMAMRRRRYLSDERFYVRCVSRPGWGL